MQAVETRPARMGLNREVLMKALKNWPILVFAGLIGIYLLQYTLCLAVQFWNRFGSVIIGIAVLIASACALLAFLRSRTNRRNDDDDGGDGGQHFHFHFYD